MNRPAGMAARIASSTLPVALATSIAVALMLALSIGSAVAQTAAPAGPAAAPTSLPMQSASAASPVFGLMQGMVGLVVVIALIFAAGWLMKKIGPKARASGLVQVVGGASVGPREKVVVVRFGDRTLLLGVAPGQVSLLDATDTPLDADAAAGSTAAPGQPRFADRLRAARRNA